MPVLKGVGMPGEGDRRALRFPHAEIPLGGTEDWGAAFCPWFAPLIEISTETAVASGVETVKVAVFDRQGHGRRVGVMDGDELVDLTTWAGPLGCCPLASFLARADVAVPPLDGDRVPIEDVTLLPPSVGSKAPLCVGLNYAEHGAEAGGRQGTSAQPALFSRYWPSLVGHGSPIVRPRASEQLDFEGELVVVIGKHCRAVPRAKALAVVAGYTIGQEGSVRDWQRRAPTPVAGKNFAQTGAMGPWLVTADEVPDPADLRIITSVNGEIQQDGATATMIWDVPALVEHVSAFLPLSPGDTLFTGTPAGTFSDRGKQRWLTAGDVVAVEIPGIGRLQNHIVDEPQTARPY